MADSSGKRPMKPPVLALASAAIALLLAAPAAAQYTFDDPGADDIGPGTKVFGSIKDEKGKPVMGAMLLVEKAYILVTDFSGRYHGNIPPSVDVNKAQVACSKAGYRFVRAAKRPGPPAKKKSVQIDCVLQTGK